MFHPLVRFDRISLLTIPIQCNSLLASAGEVFHVIRRTHDYPFVVLVTLIFLKMKSARPDAIDKA